MSRSVVTAPGRRVSFPSGRPGSPSLSPTRQQLSRSPPRASPGGSRGVLRRRRFAIDPAVRFRNRNLGPVANQRGGGAMGELLPGWSVPDDLDEDALVTPAVELPVKDLLPRTEVELPSRNSNNDLAPHDLALVVCVTVVLPRAVVVVALGAWIVRGERLEPARVILVQTRRVVVDEDAGGDVHRVDEAETFLHAARLHL